VTVDELLADREPLAAAILRAGGLLRFGQQHLRDATPVPLAADGRPMTLYEKIVRRHLLATPVTPDHPQVGDGCFVRADRRFIHEYYTGMAVHMLDATFGAAATSCRTATASWCSRTTPPTWPRARRT
jgi:3-isopropylmalate/(R)-2-methylmalate dehydratase large subunit